LSAAQCHLKQTYVGSVQALVAAAETKDPHTRQHSETVSRYSEMLGRRLGLPRSQIEILSIAALLHDVGKIGVPDSILQKPGPLTPAEYDLVKQHPEIALRILEHTGFLADELPLILHHHERYDGKGYPAGLAGTDIPPGARILAVADSLDVMFSDRSYKRGMSREQVREELYRCAGRQWDPDVARAAVDCLDAHPRAFPLAVPA